MREGRGDSLGGRASPLQFEVPCFPVRFHQTGNNKSLLDENTDFGGFVGFAPLKNPRITVYAVVFAPRTENVLGGAHAAPIFREVTDEVLHYLKVAPDKN